MQSSFRAYNREGKRDPHGEIELLHSLGASHLQHDPTVNAQWTLKVFTELQNFLDNANYKPKKCSHPTSTLRLMNHNACIWHSISHPLFSTSKKKCSLACSYSKTDCTNLRLYLRRSCVAKSLLTEIKVKEKK